MMIKLLILIFVSISSIFATSDIVVTNYAECTEMAKYYIQAHNATPPELAIVVAVCQGILNPEDVGIGGGFYAVIYDGYNRKATHLEAEVKAPENFSLSKPNWAIGVLSALKGYEALFKIKSSGFRSKLKWKDLFTKNIILARERSKKKLSTTLQKIADEGPASSLYKKNGHFQKKVLDDLKSHNATLKSQDFTSYVIQDKEPFRQNCFNYSIATTRIPGSGTTLIIGCKIIEAASTRLVNLSEAKQKHFLYQTLRFILSIKPLLRSKNFNLESVLAETSSIATLILNSLDSTWDTGPIKKFGNYQVRNVIGDFDQNEPGVNSVIIKRGKYAITMSNNRPYQNRLKTENLGFSYNNFLQNFDIVHPTGPNRPVPNKRPQTQISPLILYSKKNNPVMMVAGSGPGCSISATLNILFDYFISQKSLRDSVRTPFCTPRYVNGVEQAVCDPNISSAVKQKFIDNRMSLVQENLIGGVVAASTLKKDVKGVSSSRSNEAVYLSENSSSGTENHVQIQTTTVRPRQPGVSTYSPPSSVGSRRPTVSSGQRSTTARPNSRQTTTTRRTLVAIPAQNFGNEDADD